jgi:DNA repair photolyase
MDKPAIRYNTIECKSLLNKSGLSDYAVNCYSGCGHGCIYCYARFATRYTHPQEEWGSFVDIKANAPQVLAREVRRKPVGHVILSSVCDGWQPVEERYQLTRQCLEILMRYQYKVSILTKNALAGRDLDLLMPGNAEFGVTITTLDARLAGLIEPGASPPQARLELLEKAKSRGIRTYAFIGPLLPVLEDNEQNVTALLKAVKETGAEYILVDKLNLRYGVWPALFKFLRQHNPALIPEYRKTFFTEAGKSAYTTGLSSLVDTAAGKLGIKDKINLCV